MAASLSKVFVEQVEAFIAGTIDASELEISLIEASHNIHKNLEADDEAYRLAGAALRFLAEYDREHRTEESLRRELSALCREGKPALRRPAP